MKTMVHYTLALCMVAFIIPGTFAANNASSTYNSKCAMCHGIDGRGYTAPGKALNTGSFLDRGVLKMTDPEMTLIVRNGIKNMPAFKNKLSKEDIQGLVAYIHVLQTKK